MGRSIMLACLLMLLGCSGARSGENRATPFLAQALQSRLAAGDIPDMGLIRQRSPDVYYLVQDTQLVREGEALAGEQLAMVDRRLRPVTAAEVLEISRREGKPIFYIEVSHLRREGSIWRLVMSVDYRDANTFGGAKLCCCGGDARFEKQGERFVFIEWESQWCS